MIAYVYFTKEAEKDNYFEGCTGDRRLIWDEKFTVEFTDTDDLKEKLADYITMHFDVWHNNFIEFVNNECDNKRFDYNQGEDEQGTQVDITEHEPDGYYAAYSFYITKVTTEIEYKFDELKS